MTIKFQFTRKKVIHNKFQHPNNNNEKYLLLLSPVIKRILWLLINEKEYLHPQKKFNKMMNEAKIFWRGKQPEKEKTNDKRAAQCQQVVQQQSR